MLRNTQARVLAALTWFIAACAPTEMPPPPVASPSPPVVEVPPPPPSVPDAKVAGPADDRPANDRPAPAATIAAPAPAPSGPRATSLEALRNPRARRAPRASALLV